MKNSDKKLIRIFQEVEYRGVPEHLKCIQTWCWKKLLIRHEKLLFNTMYKKGGVSNIAFKNHPLYPELAMAIKYAMKNYKFDRKVKVSSFLVNTFKIFITRFYTSSENKSVCQEMVQNSDYYHDPDGDEKELKFERLFKEAEIESVVSKESVTEEFIKKLYFGISCKKPYKLVEIYKVVPEYGKYRERIKDILSKI